MADYYFKLCVCVRVCVCVCVCVARVGGCMRALVKFCMYTLLHPECV